jgi:hypothetical protein
MKRPNRTPLLASLHAPVFAEGNTKFSMPVSAANPIPEIAPTTASPDTVSGSSLSLRRMKSGYQAPKAGKERRTDVRAALSIHSAVL